MKVLITGINGLIGKAIALTLHKQHEIIGLSKSTENKTGLVIPYFCVDIAKKNDFNLLQHIDVDIIIHSAACLDTNNFNDDVILTNCLGTKNICEFAIAKACKKVIYISSIPIIGKPIEIPVTEEHPIHPTKIYHITKYFGELFLQNTLESEILTILRIPSPIGIEMPKNKIIPVFLKKSMNHEDIILLGKGERVQNYIDVDDIGNAVFLLLQKNIHGTYNIASTTSYTNTQLAQLCIHLFTSKSKILYQGIDIEENDKWIVSTDKAKQDFGFESRISLKDSLSKIAQNL